MHAPLILVILLGLACCWRVSCQQGMPVVFSVYASRHGSVVVSSRQTGALSQDDIMHRPAANNLDNDLNHVLAECDEGPSLGEHLCGCA